MASINRSDCSADRRNGHGKGDLPRRGSEEGVRKNTALWGASPCCKAPILRIGGSRKRRVCEKCGTEL